MNVNNLFQLKQVATLFQNIFNKLVSATLNFVILDYCTTILEYFIYLIKFVKLKILNRWRSFSKNYFFTVICLQHKFDTHITVFIWPIDFFTHIFQKGGNLLIFFVERHPSITKNCKKNK